MKTNAIQRIEFVAGPLDGYVSTFVGPQRPFVAVKTSAMSPEEGYLPILLRVLFFHDQLLPRLIAIYELRTCKSRPCYHYIRSYSEKLLKLDAQYVDTTVELP